MLSYNDEMEADRLIPIEDNSLSRKEQYRVQYYKRLLREGIEPKEIEKRVLRNNKRAARRKEILRNCAKMNIYNKTNYSGGYENEYNR